MKLIARIFAIEALTCAIILALITKDMERDLAAIAILAAFAGWLAWYQSQLKGSEK